MSHLRHFGTCCRSAPITQQTFKTLNLSLQQPCLRTSLCFRDIVTISALVPISIRDNFGMHFTNGHICDSTKGSPNDGSVLWQLLLSISIIFLPTHGSSASTDRSVFYTIAYCIAYFIAYWFLLIVLPIVLPFGLTILRVVLPRKSAGCAAALQDKSLRVVLPGKAAGVCRWCCWYCKAKRQNKAIQQAIQ